LHREELEELKKRKTALEDELKFMLLPKDPREDRNYPRNKRRTGGEEAALFAASAFQNVFEISRSAPLEVEVIDSNPLDLAV